MNDLISKKDAIDALKICDNNEDGINCHKCPLRDERWDGAWEDDETNCYTKLMRDSAKLLELPPAQPDEKLGKCRFEYINACRIVAYSTPDTTKKDISDAYAVIKALQPIFGDVTF